MSRRAGACDLLQWLSRSGSHLGAPLQTGGRGASIGGSRVSPERRRGGVVTTPSPHQGTPGVPYGAKLRFA